MRNKLILIFLGLLVVFAVSFYFISQKRLRINTEKQFARKWDRKDEFVLVIGESFCDICQEYTKETLVPFVKKHGQKDLIVIYWDKTFDRNYDAFLEFLTRYDIKDYVSPTTYYIKDGKIVDSFKDFRSLEELEAFIEKNK